MAHDDPSRKRLAEQESQPTVRVVDVGSTPEILVVEDDPAVLGMLEVVLRHYGFGVRLATSGAEALELFRKHQQTIDLVLLDVQMPGALDGPATLLELRRLDPQVRSVFLSGHTGNYTHEDLIARGAACVLTKPILSLDEFAATLRSVANVAR
jgi:CheY-like chemotaxis protein